MSEKDQKESKENPALGFIDNILGGIRKFLDEKKFLELADEITYLSLRKVVDILKNTFIPMNIEGEENVPVFKPAILTSIADEPIDMFLGTALTPRKIHFMFPAKFFETPGLKHLLDSIGAFRGTKSKDDLEPIQKVMEFINKKKELVAMVPVDDGERDKLVKQVAGIIKFAAGLPTQIIPYASSSIKHYSLGKHINFIVAKPIDVKKNISRDERYKLAEEIVSKIMEMKETIKEKELSKSRKNKTQQ
ncbi:MAG: lysophospholipid acyltransferase family protein [Promethearchaeota archaeon]